MPMKPKERDALEILLVKLMSKQDDATHYNEVRDMTACNDAKGDREFVRRQIVAFVEMITP